MKRRTFLKVLSISSVFTYCYNALGFPSFFAFFKKKKVFRSDLISQSCWFDGSSDSLSYTPGSDADNPQKYTVHVWVRRLGFGSGRVLVGYNGAGGTNISGVYFDTDDGLTLYHKGNTCRSKHKFRDHQWLQIVAHFDIANGTTSLRGRAWVNGTEITEWEADQRNLWTGDGWVGKSGVPMYWGNDGANDTSKMILAQAAYFDDQLIAPENFYETISFGQNGSQIVPLSDSKLAAMTSLGTMGSILTTAIGDGTDASSNGKNWTANSMSHAANGSSDTPSNAYPIWNRLIARTEEYNYWSMDNGGQRYTRTHGSSGGVDSSYGYTIPNGSGKWAWKLTIANVNPSNIYIGVQGVGKDQGEDISNHAWAMSYIRGVSFNPTPYYLKGDSSSDSISNATTPADGMEVVVYYDSDTQKLWVKQGSTYLNDTAGSTANPHTDTNPMFDLSAISDFKEGIMWYYGCYDGSDKSIADVDPTFSDGNFKSLLYTSRPTISHQGIDHFAMTTHTGNETAKAVGSFGFKPDWFWSKNIDYTTNFFFANAIRGVNKGWNTNTTGAELDDTGDGTNGSFTAFNTTSVQLGTGTGMSDNAVNRNTNDYLLWAGKLDGTSGSANSDGTISSTVAPAQAGHMSLGTFTGNGTSGATIGHGLGTKPEMVMVYNLAQTAARSCIVGYSVSDGAFTEGLFLGSNNSKTTSTSYFNNTEPTTSVFTVGDSVATNENTKLLQFMAFKSVPGLCKVGSFKGNGVVDGPYVSLGFRPKWLILKNTSATEYFAMYNDEYQKYNPQTGLFLMGTNGSIDYNTAHAIDFLSDGFKVRAWDGKINGSDAAFIYVAIADIAQGGTDLPVIWGY